MPPPPLNDLKAARITEALATINIAMLGRVWQEIDFAVLRSY